MIAEHVSSSTGRYMKKLLLKDVISLAVFPAIFMFGLTQAQAQSIDYASLQTLFGEPVTTSATGKPQRVSEAPVDMNIITADDIRRSGARDIAEVLRSVPGVNVLQSTRQDYDVGIRGYNQPYSSNLLVLVNGRQVYLDDYGYTNWAAIPVQLSEIRQIEVVKGPNTALFGFNAADGVINIVTMNPLYDKTSNASVTGGTGAYREGSFVDTFKVNEDFGVRVSAGASKADEFGRSVNPAEPPSVFTSPQKHALNVDSIVQITPKSQLRVEASTSGVQQSDMTAFDFLTNARYSTNSIKTDYEADTAAGLIKATAYKNWLDTDFTSDLYSPDSSGAISNNVSVMQLADTFKVGISNTFRIQGEYRHNALDGSLIGPVGSSIQENIYALSGMWSWSINPDWEWTNSARVDRLQLAHSGPIDPSSPLTDGDFDRNITKPSYNSGLVWKATPDDSFRFNTGRGLRMASLFDFGISLAPGYKVGGFFPLLNIGNPEDNPTYVTDYELGWDHKVEDIEGAFKADVFTERTTDALGGTGSLISCPIASGFPGCTSANPDFVTQGGNIGSSSSVGTELDLQGKYDDNWSWDVNDTIEKIYDHYTDPTTDTKDQTPVSLTSFHLGYQDGPWESDAFVYFNTRFKQPEPSANPLVTSPLATMPAHISLSGRVGYKINDQTTIAISGQELQASQAVTSTALETERRVFLSLDRSF